MPSVARELPLDQPINEPTFYTEEELFDLRRSLLLYARCFKPGYERNQHRQVAESLARLFKDKAWLAVHTVPRSDSP